MDTEGISKAVSLSLIAKSDLEQEALLGEVESILEYVKDVQSISNGNKNKIKQKVNIFREDLVSVDAGKYTEKMLSQAPARFKEWFLSKKIL